ncbi:unnamed protein product [Brugia timori]|uniref:Ovule protein n=1 Tax=Brugia timori TaxID=42155 RepID=A0A0R3R103_9BILA|nr:unnamed protein product [Brugia timori]
MVLVEYPRYFSGIVYYNGCVVDEKPTKVKLSFYLIVSFWKNCLGENLANQHATAAYARQEWTTRTGVTKHGSVLVPILVSSLSLDAVSLLIMNPLHGVVDAAAAAATASYLQKMDSFSCS